MTLEQYWSILVKQWKLILACFLITGLSAYVVSLLMTPIFQSTAIVQITIRSASNQADINGLLASDQLVQTEAKLASSQPVLREVVSHHSGVTFEQLAKETTVTPELNTQLFEISVQDASPNQAAVLANDIATTLIKQQLQIAQQANNQANSQIQQGLETAKKQINTLKGQIVALQAASGTDISIKQPQINALQTELSGDQQHYTQLQTALDQLELTEAQNNNFLQIAQTAQPDTHVVQPNKLLNTSAGLLVGLFLGMLLAFLFEQLDTRVHTPEVLTQLLGLPVLAIVWRGRSLKAEDVINPQGHDANAEAYRILRTNIGFSSIDKPIHSLVVTSAMPGEGKSVVSTNLAIFMAKAGKKTLLIDADLRRPTIYEKLNLSSDKKGLSNAVMELSMTSASMPAVSPPSQQFLGPRMDSIYPVDPPSQSFSTSSLDPFLHSVGITHLRVMPSGPLPPNPSELLDSRAMERFLAMLPKSGIDVVIFDAPPILGLSDASILASKVDGTIVVVDTTRTHKKQLKQVKLLLTQAGANMLGCVMNKQRRTRNDASSYYYYSRNTEQENANMPRGTSITLPSNYAGDAVPSLHHSQKGGQRED